MLKIDWAGVEAFLLHVHLINIYTLNTGLCKENRCQSPVKVWETNNI